MQYQRFAIAKMCRSVPLTIAEANDLAEEWRLHGFTAQGQMLADFAKLYRRQQKAGG